MFLIVVLLWLLVAVPLLIPYWKEFKWGTEFFSRLSLSIAGGIVLFFVCWGIYISVSPTPYDYGDLKVESSNIICQIDGIQNESLQTQEIVLTNINKYNKRLRDTQRYQGSFFVPFGSNDKFDELPYIDNFDNFDKGLLINSMYDQYEEQGVTPSPSYAPSF